MKGERQLLGIGEYLIGLACQRLPKDIREERHREWVAELPPSCTIPRSGSPRGAQFACWAMRQTLCGARTAKVTSSFPTPRLALLASS